MAFIVGNAIFPVCLLDKPWECLRIMTARLESTLFEPFVAVALGLCVFRGCVPVHCTLTPCVKELLSARCLLSLFGVCQPP